MLLTPPTYYCLTCPREPTAPRLQMARRQVHAYLFDLNGVDRIQYLSGYCRACRTTYMPSYMVCDRNRQYYTQGEGQLPLIFQVSERNFMTYKLADYFNNLQMMAVVSIYNLAGSFNHTHAPINDQDTVTYSLSEHVLTLALDIHRLMRSANEQGIWLKSIASDDDDDQFLSAMSEHLDRMKTAEHFGSMHVCSNCTQSVLPPDMEVDTKIPRAVVTDAVRIGHWSCSISNMQLKALNPISEDNHCDNPLDDVTDRFCPLHTRLLEGICQAQPCMAPAILGQRTCGCVEHIAALQRAEARGPSEILDSAQPNEHNRIELSRRRSHHEQLMVATCGYIMGRKTFYRSESVRRVKDFILEIFRSNLPPVIFYHNATDLRFQIHEARDDAYRFQNTLVLSGQRATDDSPFNSSGAQSVFAWLGGFEHICRHMHSTRYQFFLEEMIRLHNNLLEDRRVASHLIR